MHNSFISQMSKERVLVVIFPLPHGASLWWRHGMETLYVLPKDSPHKGFGVRRFNIVSSVSLNRLLDKESSWWCFETRLRPCDVTVLWAWLYLQHIHEDESTQTAPWIFLITETSCQLLGVSPPSTRLFVQHLARANIKHQDYCTAFCAGNPVTRLVECLHKGSLIRKGFSCHDAIMWHLMPGPP